MGLFNRIFKIVRHLYEHKTNSSYPMNQNKDEISKKRLMMVTNVEDYRIDIFPKPNDRLKSIIQAVPITV